MEKMVKLHIRKCGPERKLQPDKKIDLDERIRRIREQNKARERRFKEIEDDKLHASNDGSEDTRGGEKSKAADVCQSEKAMKGVMAVAGGKKFAKGRGQRLLEMSKAPLRAMEFESRARKKLKELEENGQSHKESKSLAQLSMGKKSIPKKDEWGKNETSLKEAQEVLPNTPRMNHGYNDKKDESKLHGSPWQKQHDRPELMKSQGSSWTPMKPNDSQENTSEVKEVCCEDWNTELMDIDEMMIKQDTELSEQSNEPVPTGSDFDEVNVKKNTGLYENSYATERNSAEHEQHSTTTSLEEIHEVKELCCEDWSTEIMDVDELMIEPDTDREPEVSERLNEQVPSSSEVNVEKNMGLYENGDVKERNSAENEQHSTATSLEEIHERCHDQSVLEDGRKVKNENVCESSNNGEEVREISTGQTITVLPNKQEQVEQESISFPKETKIKTKSSKKDKKPKITVNTKIKKTASSSSFDESMAMFSPLDIPNNWGDCDFDEGSNESTFYHQTLSFK